MTSCHTRTEEELQEAALMDEDTAGFGEIQNTPHETLQGPAAGRRSIGVNNTISDTISATRRWILTAVKLATLVVLEVPLRTLEQMGRITLRLEESPFASADEMLTKVGGLPRWTTIKNLSQTDLEGGELELQDMKGSWKDSAVASQQNGTNYKHRSTQQSSANADRRRENNTPKTKEEVKKTPAMSKLETATEVGKEPRTLHGSSRDIIRTSSLTTSRPTSPSHARSCTGSRWKTSTLTLLFLTVMTSDTRVDAKTEYSLEKREYNPRSMPNITFTVYDCTRSPDNVYSGIDLGQIDECKDIRHDYEEPTEDTKITLIQSNVPQTIKVARCKLTISKNLAFSGMHGHIYRTTDYVVDKSLYVNREACFTMVKYRTFTCPTEVCRGRPSHQFKVPLNKTKVVTWYTYGGYDEDSWPIPETFVPEGQTQSVYAIETSTLKVTLDEYVGEVDFSNDVLTVPALNTRMDHDLTFSPQDNNGLLAWRKAKYRCNETLSKISTNNATIYKLKKDRLAPGADHELSGAMVIIQNQEEDRSSGVVIQPGYHSCLGQCHRTNVKDLVACVGDVQGVDDISTRPATSATRINMQAMATLLYMTNRLDRYELSERMHASMCELDRRTIAQDYASILNSRNPYALHGMELAKSGKAVNKTQAITIRGIVGYLHNCTAQVARLVQVSNCTQQIPCEIIDHMTGKPRLAFADPVNFHLLDYPSVIKCTPGLPVQYRINDVYYCHGPEHRSCPSGTEPTVIRPSVGSGAGGILNGDIEGMTGLTITPEQLETIREVHENTEHGDVVLTNVVQNVMANTMNLNGGEPMGIHLGMPLTKLDIDFLTGTVAGQMFFLFRIFGQFYLHVFGIMIILSLAQYIFNSCYRIYYVWIHNDKRIGWYLFKAFLAVLFSSAVLPGLILVAVTKAVRERLNEDREKVIADPDYTIYKERVAFTERTIDNMRDFILQHHSGDKDEAYQRLTNSVYPSEQLAQLRRREQRVRESEGNLQGIVEEFSNRTSGGEAEEHWVGDKTPGLLEAVTEAGDRDVCQEFVSSLGRNSKDSEDTKTKKKNAVIRLIRTKKRDLEETERELDEALDKENEHPQKAPGKESPDVKRLQDSYRSQHDNLRGLESFLGHLINEETASSRIDGVEPNGARRKR